MLDEMTLWEREVFEKEYSDLNWYKGKQAKEVKAMEKDRQKVGLGAVFSSPQYFLVSHTESQRCLELTKNQRDIFDKVKKFIFDSRSLSASHHRSARLALPNQFPARDRAFITKLSEELHLDVGWDEYDRNQNLVTWRLPRLSHQVGDEKEEEGGITIEEDGSTANSEWEDEASGDDDEAHAAVDRVLKKYEKAPVVDLDAQGSFDERHERSVKEKMDEWKRGYYRV